MQASPSILVLTLHRRIWRLTLDGAFYGDYRTRRHADDSAEAAARGLRAQGSAVTVVTSPVIQ